MTIKELNRDIKRLWNNHEKMEESKVKAELSRLYNANDSFEYLNANSIKILLRLNLRYRVIPLHNFGIFIKL